jgi:hypothetical protein
MNKIHKALKTKDGKEIKNSIAESLKKILSEKLKREKRKIANSILTEADALTDIQTADDGADADSPAGGPIRIVKSQPHPNFYRYQFPFQSRMVVVDFEPLGNQEYKAYFYAKGLQDDENPYKRLGISAIANIPSLFTNVLRAVEMFLQTRKPISLRFTGGNDNMAFPAIFHRYIYPLLKRFANEQRAKYIVSRGDTKTKQDNAAFILKRGGSTSNLKSQSWQPGKSSDQVSEPVKAQEEVANVTGAGVATDVPFKPLKKEIERRK